MEAIKDKKLKEAQKLKNEEKYQEALNIINHFEKKKDIPPDDQILGLILKADILRILGHYKHAITIAEEAFEMSQKLENKHQEFNSFKIKIQTLTDDHRPFKAKELLEQLMNIYKSLEKISTSDLMRREADLAYITGRIYYENGGYNQAEEKFKESLELQEKLGDKAKIAENLVNLSYIYNKRAEFPQASQNLEENLTLEGIRQIDKCLVLAGMGAVYITKGEFDKALICNKQWQEIARDIKNESIEANALQEKGRIYMMRGDLEKALEFSEQSLNLFKSTSVIMERANLFFNIIRICIDLDPISKANKIIKYLIAFKELVEEEKDEHLSISFDLTHSLVLKRSANLDERSKAKKILKSLIEKDLYYGWHNFWEIEVIIHLCDLLLMEFHESKKLEILDELQPLVLKLKKLTKKRNSMSRLAQTNLLLAQLALIQMNMGDARRYLTEAQETANEHGLQLLTRQISHEHDKLITQLDEWEALKTKKAPISERMDLVSLEETIDLILKKRAVEPPKLIDEIPVLLLIIAEGGIPAFSNYFTEELSFEDGFISNFLSAFNTFSEEVFSKGLDRAKFGEFILVMDSIGPHTVCYLFKGQSYLAMQKLIQFAHRVQNTASIWNALENFQKTHQVIELGDNPSLESLITEIFIKKNPEILKPT